MAWRPGRDGRHDAAGRRDRLLHVFVGDRHRRVAGERRPPGDHLVEHDPERVEVGAGIDVLALRLLGREVGGGPHDRAGLGEVAGPAGHGPGDTEVGHLHLAGVVDDDVGRLDVAMHHPVAVSEAERRGDPGRQIGGPVGVDRGGLADDLGQGPARHVLHHHEVRGVDGAPVVDGDDVGVGQVGGGLRLAAEPLDEGGVGRELGEHDLDGHGPIERACPVRRRPRPSRLGPACAAPRSARR